MTSALIGPADPGAVHVMTYNLRGPQDPAPLRWADRRARVTEIVRRESPTVLGTQEGRAHHITDLARDLRGSYDWVGIGRLGGSRSEFTAVFYDTARVDLVAFDHLWLSSLPRVTGSRTWGNWRHPRMLTWVALYDRARRQEFVVVNTHLDHRSPRSRVRSAHLVRRLVRRTFRPAGRPVVALGDFNDRPGSPAHEVLCGPRGVLTDAWDAAQTRLTLSWRSGNRYEAPVPGTRIDWVLTGPEWAVERIGVNTAMPGGRHASDHWPVQALIRLRGAQPDAAGPAR